MMRFFFKLLAAIDLSGVFGVMLIRAAITERGYYAVGGEFFLIILLAWAGWVLGGYLADLVGCKK